MANLISPDGRKYSTDSAVEITRLKARGYTEVAVPKPVDPKK